MSDGKNALSLLGLALRGGRLEVGDEAAALSARNGTARLLLTASDAGAKTLRRAQFLAEEGHCLLLAVPFSKAELGGALGRGAAAVVAVTDLGLAAAVAEKLALLDPEGCGGAAERMRLKVRRAKERKESPRKRPPPEERSESWRPRDGRPRKRKPESGKPSARRPDGWKPEGGKPRDGRPGKRKPESGKPSARRPDGWKPESGKPSARKSGGWKPKGGKAGAHGPGGRRPKDGGPREQKRPSRSGPKGRGHGGGS